MGLYLDDKPVSVKEACEILGVNYSDIPKHRKKVLQLPVKVIDDKGTKRSSKSYGGKPEYSVYVDSLQREVKIRWAITQRKENDKFIYSPNTLWILPAEDGSYIVNNIDEFFFRWVCPSCLHSPFHKKEMAWAYEYQDKDSDAKNEIAREEAIINAMAIVIGNNSWSDSQLIHLAKGMGIGGVDDMTINVVKKQLKDRIHRDPIKFYAQATSREIMFNGKIQEAIDKNVLQLRTLNGMQRWYLGDQEVLPISHGQIPADEIRRYLAENWFKYDKQIADALNNINIASLLSRPENDSAFESLQTQEKTKAELTQEEIDQLSEWRKDDKWEAKMRVIDEYDKSDPARMHPAQLKSWQTNKVAYDLWKKEQEQSVTV